MPFPTAYADVAIIDCVVMPLIDCGDLFLACFGGCKKEVPAERWLVIAEIVPLALGYSIVNHIFLR